MFTSIFNLSRLSPVVSFIDCWFGCYLCHSVGQTLRATVMRAFGIHLSRYHDTIDFCLRQNRKLTDILHFRFSHREASAVQAVWQVRCDEVENYYVYGSSNEVSYLGTGGLSASLRKAIDQNRCEPLCWVSYVSRLFLLTPLFLMLFLILRHFSLRASFT